MAQHLEVPNIVGVEDIPGIVGLEIIREGTRKAIAYGSVGSFFLILGLVTLLGLAAWVMRGVELEGVLQLLTTVAAVLGGVVGAVVGFYFREEE